MAPRDAFQNLNGQDLERLAALSAVSRAINSSLNLDDVLARVMDVTRSVLGAQRAFVMLDRGGERPDLVIARGLEAGTDEEAYPSTIVRHVLTRGEALLSNSVLTDERFHESGSLRLLGVRSILCAPMRSLGRVQGLIYLDRTDRKASFSQTDLEVLRIIADMAVAALERAHYFQDLAQAEKMAAVGTLLAGVAHEIRNPITAILGYSQLLDEGLEDPAEAGEMARFIFAEAVRCRDLVQRLLDLAHRQPAPREPVDASSLARAVARLVTLEFRQAGVRLETSLEEGVRRVPMSTSEMTQVLLNLLRNARQAVEGTASPRVSLSVREMPDGVRLQVADKGPGIPPAHLSRIFEPFFTTRGGAGTGLGLYLSYGIVRDHGGSLRVHNDPEGGAVFTVEIPSGEGRAPAPPLQDFLDEELERT